MAFLTIAPINPGHTLVIPKKHYNDIFEIEDESLGKLMEACKPIPKAESNFLLSSSVAPFK